MTSVWMIEGIYQINKFCKYNLLHQISILPNNPLIYLFTILHMFGLQSNVLSSNVP